MQLVRLAPLVLVPGLASGQGSPFVNWETPHVRPLALTPNGTRLLAVNTPGARLEVFSVGDAGLVHEDSIPVGLDPVSVRARTEGEAWVVNHVSDSVSIVDLASGHVVRTLATDDEPADVVFAGAPPRAFVTCSSVNRILVFDPADLDAPPARIEVLAEDPRALAAAPDGSAVYAAVFESGNRTTILGGGFDDSIVGNVLGFANVVSDPDGPWGGQNPPPNAGSSFEPPIAAGLPAPPEVSLIVRRDAAGRWHDDNGGDWTDFVTGPLAPRSGRPVGWDLYDHDVVVLDPTTGAATYATGLMNVGMALAVHPTTGVLALVGTDATNEVRFEPNLTGRFVRVDLALVDPRTMKSRVVDLNPHLDYSTGTVTQAERDLSIADPRGIAWDPTGTTAWVTGMGSNNLVELDAAGARRRAEPIEVGEGPTGVVVDRKRPRVYVLNKFESSVSVIDAGAGVELARLSFHDPEPPAIKRGRRHLYDARRTSGLGITACAACHVDARLDRLAWDLGNPAGSMKSTAGQNKLTGLVPGAPPFRDWHPMKGPMVTQTLQDIIGKEPHHWRGDRDGLEEFNGAFVGLLGDDAGLSPAEMQEFEDFLATIHFPPNPFRNTRNRFATDVELPGHFRSGRFGPRGTPLPSGNPRRGMNRLYLPDQRRIDGGVAACVTCHTLPTGMGTNFDQDGSLPMQAFQPGPNGELHHALVSVDGTTNRTMKIPQLRNLYDKVGFEVTQPRSLAGFGFLHDGSIPSLAEFLSVPAFDVRDDQEVADLVALLLSFSGSGDAMRAGSTTNRLEPPGTPSQDTHALVGRQTTFRGTGDDAALLDELLSRADAGELGVVVKGPLAGLARGWTYVGGDLFQSDRAAETYARGALESLAKPGQELTFTAVPPGTETRIGIDRDEDGAFDRDELDLGTDPADPASLPAAGPGRRGTGTRPTPQGP